MTCCAAFRPRRRKNLVAVLLTGMKAQRNLGEDVRQFDAIYPRLAKDYNVVFFIPSSWRAST